MKEQKNIFMLVSVVVIIVCGVILFGSVKNGSASEPAQENVFPVKVMRAVTRSFSAQDTYGGFIKGQDQSMIAPKINGRVVEIKKHDGDMVRKGDVIAILSADELTQQVASAQDMVTSLGDTLRDTEKYYKQKIDEAKDDDASKEAVKSAKRLRDLQMQSVQNSIVESQGSMRVAQSLAKEAVVRAPFDGVITRVFQEKGQLVGPTTPICEIADRSVMEVEIFVSDNVAQALLVKDKIELRDEKDHVIGGTVHSIGERTQGNAQKIRVIVQINDPSPVQLGQYVTMSLPSHSIQDNVIVIPENSVIRKYDDTFVFVVENDRIVQKNIILGVSYDGSVAVVSGLSEGEQVVTEGMHAVKQHNVVHIYE